MGDEVKLKMMLPNDETHREITVVTTKTVKALKAEILEQHWPEGATPVENIERLRLFVNGKELGGKDGGAADGVSIADCKLSTFSAAMITVHVMPVEKSTEPVAEKDTAKCFCTLL